MFNVNFYAKEYGAKKKVLKFTCEEEVAPKEQSEEVKTEGALEGIKRAETKEFAFIHIFERMLPVFWQQFFEKNLNILG